MANPYRPPLNKRLLDLALALAAVAVLWPVFLVLVVALLATQGRPIFYVAERMKTPEQAFGLVKFRTMTEDPNDSGVSGGDKNSRLTQMGRFLRKTRLDEMPQLWNIIRGDMSFVGPRPPLRQYVEAFPELYGEVLKSQPGITGLATLVFHRHEERLLAPCKTVEETDEVYRRRCVPRKAELDLIYQRNWSLCGDLAILGRTLAGILRRG